MKRYNHKGIKVSIRPLDEPRLKTQAQELQNPSFEVSVVWKHPAVKAVQCKLHMWLCGQISAVYFYTLLNMNAHISKSTCKCISEALEICFPALYLHVETISRH